MRVQLSKKIRFEVFKRDGFKCQYCGKSAPDVVLHCDHIQPVASGGENDILNLVTSCQDCNLGKGARELGDNAVVRAQVDQMRDLEERRQQLEMLMEWRMSLLAADQDALDKICAHIGRTTGCEPNDRGREDLRRWLQRSSPAELVGAVDEAFRFYLLNENGQPTSESWHTAFNKIPNIMGLRKQAEERPYIPRLAYIQGIIRKRSGARRYNCMDYLEHLHLCGADLDEMERRAKRIGVLDDFEGPYDAWLASIGRPF